MTRLPTVLGLTSLALGIGEGSELRQPMARVVIGGLLSSTLITLVLTLVIDTILEDRSERARAAVTTDLQNRLRRLNRCRCGNEEVLLSGRFPAYTTTGDIPEAASLRGIPYEVFPVRGRNSRGDRLMRRL